MSKILNKIFMTLRIRSPFKLYSGLYPLDLCCVIFTDDYQIRSDQISRSVMSDSLRPHESQHAEKHNLQIEKTAEFFLSGCFFSTSNIYQRDL